MKKRLACLAALCLTVLVALLSASLSAGETSQKWSDPATWGGRPPQAGADVTIPAGKRVILDVSPPPLGHLQIDGTLAFADGGLSLSASGVDVAGRLEIGTEKAPLRHPATLTLTAGGDGLKCLGVTGTLEMHGASRGLSWTHLGRSAPAGSRQLTLAAPPGWAAGDAVVVASTDFDPAHAETGTVARVDGPRVTLAGPLRWGHWGAAADGVDERAEVGLLSHDIVVQGDAASEAHGMGGQVMVMRGGTAHVEGVEFTRMGQRGEVGRYPLHFHLAGDQRGACVVGCSLHHCFNRCLTLHGTDGVLVSSNVAYDTIGHCYFLEDGVETGNVLENNLGLLTRRARPGEAILPSDLTPATFWVTNPANVLRGNAAAGSDGDGFWYSLPPHPTGLSRTDETDRAVWPRRLPLGIFQGNTAHSNDNDGLFVDNGPNPPGITGAPNYDPPAVAVFDGLTAYKNRRRGVWLRGSRLEVAHAALADNSVGATFAASDTVLRDSLVVGRSANDADGPPKPDAPHTPVVGFEFYDGQVSVQRVLFRDFLPDRLRPAGALGYVRFTPFFVDPRNFVSGLRFERAAPVYFAPARDPGPYSLGADGYRSAAFVDRDGCVTGTPGASVSVSNPFLLTPGARAVPAWNAQVSPAPFGRLFVDDQDAAPTPVAPVRIVRADAPGSVSYNMWGSPPDGGKPPTAFQTNLVPGRRYALAFGGSAPLHLRLALRFCPAGDWVQITLPCPAGALTVRRDHLPVPLPRATGRAAFEAGSGESYFQTGRTLLVTLRVRAESRDGAATLEISAPKISGQKPSSRRR